MSTDVFDRLADQVMNISNASVYVDRAVVTIKMDHKGAAVLADRLEQAERDKAAVERVRAFCEAHCDEDGSQTLVRPTDVLVMIGELRRALDGSEANR